MRAYVEPPKVQSRSLQRIAQALKQYAPPSVEFVDTQTAAEFVFLHVIGRHDAVQRQAESLLAAKQRYAVGQWCLRSTKNPHTDDWRWLWKRAAVVWSYYDLRAAIQQDRGIARLGTVDFYRAPLGADPSVWRYYQHVKLPDSLTVLSTGQSWLTESVRELHLAARATHAEIDHLGPHVGHGARCVSGTDEDLAAFYQVSDFVSGLRRVEGFELPAAEGLLCGARPILFDREHYRRWYGPWGVFIPEAPRAAVLESLTDLFSTPARYSPITPAERKAAAAVFHWPTIIGEFWKRVAK